MVERKRVKTKVKPLRIRIADGTIAGCYDPSGVRRPIPPNRCEECEKHSDLICPPPKTRRELREIDVDKIDNPILEVEKMREDLDNIAKSLKAAGEPYFSLYVRPKEDGRFELIHHRSLLEAARRAGLKKVWAEVLPYDGKTTILAILSTAHGLFPLEEAKGIRMLIEDYGCSVEEIAIKTGKGIKWVKNRLRLLNAPIVQEALREGVIDVDEAFEIAKADPETQEAMIERIRERKVSLEEIRAHVNASKKPRVNRWAELVLEVVKEYLSIPLSKVEWLPGFIAKNELGENVNAEVDLERLTIRLYRVKYNLDTLCKDITHEGIEYCLKKSDIDVTRVLNTFTTTILEKTGLDEQKKEAYIEAVDITNKALYRSREELVNRLTELIAPIVKKEVLKRRRERKQGPSQAT
jgi:ParB-like chromosome segregation protein Spo0J